MILSILREAGYPHLLSAATCQQARRMFAAEDPDGVILDVMLPDGDGFELMREFRAASNAPVLFLSARDEDENRLLGLGLGADDYITKPFLPRELLLRLRAVLTRVYFPAVQKNTARPVFTLGDVQVDLNSGAVTSPRGRSTLTAKEFTLLEKLYENHGRIVTGDQLCRAAWGDNLYSYENTLMVHIRRLREKIEPDPSRPRYLLTARGLGYKLDLNPFSEDSPA
ncbi:MAG: response regulator transcription factor [Chloroflexi bacterium]|nr:response regulator transcription factor [Chloroflexota bacterium]